MEKKLYVKPGMRVKPLRISGLICQSGGVPYALKGVNARGANPNSEVDDDLELEISENPLSDFMGR